MGVISEVEVAELWLHAWQCHMPECAEGFKRCRSTRYFEQAEELVQALNEVRAVNDGAEG